MVAGKNTTVNIPGIKGLVFTGGQSSRMGTDKSMIEYHGVPHYQYVYRLLEDVLGSAFLSCHPARIPEGDWQIVPDIEVDMGPLSGLLAAFTSFPGHAWLAVACDLPLINKESLNYLLQNRDADKIATCYQDALTGMPEPMIAIWEPSALPYLTDQSSKGRSLRKILLQPDVLQIQPLDPAILLNANTPEEMLEIKKKIRHFS